MSPAPTLSREDANAAILRAADELFYARGISAVRMAEIRDLAVVSMRRLYTLYPSKTDLITGWLEQRHVEWMAALRSGVSERVTGGASPSEAVFDDIEDWLTRTNYRGCGFINTHAERSDLTDEHRRIIQSHKQELDAYLTELIPDVVGLAVLVDGAIVQSSIFSSTEPVHSARLAARTLEGAMTTR